MFETFSQAEAFLRAQAIQMVDLKFSDLWGRWRHVSIPAAEFNSALMTEGVGFDGSSVGLKSVKAGDMVLLPDLATGFRDPFWDVPTISFIGSASIAASAVGESRGGGDLSYETDKAPGASLYSQSTSKNRRSQLPSPLGHRST